MYLYVHDSFIQKPKYAKAIDKMEIKLISLDIKGSVTKLNTLKSITESIRLHTHENIHTVVAVGDDQTLFRVINALVTLDKKITVGYIPIGENTNIAETLGVPKDIEKACEVVSSRITRPFDVGKINEKIFFKNILLTTSPETIMTTPKYSIQFLDNNIVSIQNFSPTKNNVFGLGNPMDGSLDLFVFEQEKKFFHKKKINTQLSISDITISSDSNKPVSIIIDDGEIIKTPAHIEVLHNAIKIIVGPDRVFEF